MGILLQHARKAVLRLACCALAASLGFAAPPNVVLIMADDVGYECFGFSGSKQYATPQLDRIADSGVRFRNAFSTPLCTPSRVTIMTGKSNVRNYVDFGALSPGETTFAKLFHDAGYATAIAGKWQLQGSADAAGTPPAEAGFDTYCLWNTPLTKRPRYWTPSIEHDGKLLNLPADAYGPDVFSDFLIRFMERNREKPFFVYYPMALVHDPFLPTPDSADRNSKDEQRNFEDMVAYMDKIVGRIDATIDRLGLRDNTVLIFTADNGTHKNIQSRLDGRVIQGGKGTPTDRGTHVPLLVRAPGFGPGGRVLDDLVDFADFLPTLADVIGAAAPKSDGRSFWPRIQGKTGDPREWLFTWYFPRPFAKEFDDAYRHAEVRFARDARYKLYGDGRFFDLVADPEEQTEAPKQGAAYEKLKAALASMPAHNPHVPAR
ncbi:MAG: sulfatase-like hydrolase/transferase [Bryobacterales bacterium]|nr:sulfatase-like hydrolase/transferase [Bryobacterales bacterium]